MKQYTFFLLRTQCFSRSTTNSTLQKKSFQRRGGFESYAARLINQMEEQEKKLEQGQVVEALTDKKHKTSSGGDKEVKGSSGGQVKNEPIIPTKGTQIVDKKMRIEDQIRKQVNKKGKKHFIIDSEESVDWFVKSLVAPANSTKEYQTFRKEKDELVNSGEVPKGVEEQLKHFAKYAEIGIRKIEEEEHINERFGLDEDETRILTRKQQESLNNFNIGLIEKLQKENLQADYANLNPSEKELLNMIKSEKSQNQQIIEELREQGDISPDILHLLEDTLKSSTYEDLGIAPTHSHDILHLNESEASQQQQHTVDFFEEIPPIQQKVVNENQSIADLVQEIRGGNHGKKVLDIVEPPSSSSSSQTEQQTSSKLTRGEKKAKNAQTAEKPAEVQKVGVEEVQLEKTNESQISKPQEENKIIQKVSEMSTEKLYKMYATGDEKLNLQVFGNIPVKPLDFTSPEIYKLFKTKKPQTKKDVYNHQFEKLQVLLSVYTKEDFQNITFRKLNTDQQLAFIQNLNFIAGNGSKEKVIQCLGEISKKRRDIKIFEERKEIIAAVKSIALNHQVLASLTPQSYVSTFIGATSSMKIKDREVWTSLASYVVQNANNFDLRSLTSIIYGFFKVSAGMPVMHNYDELFSELELNVIQKLDQIQHIPNLQDPQAIATAVYSYSKSQNGSIQFFQAMEKHIIACKNMFNPVEMSNIVYSFALSINTNKEILKDLEPQVATLIPEAKPIEMTNMLWAYAQTGNMTPRLQQIFELEFKAKFEDMNAEDISKYYYNFTSLGFVGDGTFYKYLQKSLTKLIDTFEGPQLRYMFYKFDEEERSRLNTGVRGRLMDRVTELIKQNKIKGFDLNEIYNHTRNMKPNREDKSQHDFNHKCQLHLEKLRYFV